MANTVKKKDYILFAICAGICFLVFQQGDIRHTGGCSIAYLQGHILDFYEWNAYQYDLWASYMPSTYILFAIWNIPLKLFGIVEYPLREVSFWVVMYYKLLPTLAYLASAVMLYRIAAELGMEDGRAKLCMYAFLTAPIGFYSQFLFGQYDSFTVLLMLLGIYYYLKDKRGLFVLFFALSIPFKYFSLLVFIPLLLLREKVIWRIIRDIALAAVPYALELLLYYPSETFREYVLGFTPTGYVFSASFPTGSTNLSLVICTFCLVCAWAYFKNVSGKLLLAQWMCFLASLVCTVIFGLSRWHPQWLLFAVPFWVLGAFLHKDTKAFWFVDVLMMLFFCICLCNIYLDNADQAMFGWGILGRTMYGKAVMPYLGKELRMRDLYFTRNISAAGTVFTALMAAAAVFKYPPIAQVNIAQAVPNAMRALRARFIAGISIFIVPAAVCYLVAALPPYLTLDISQKGAPEAAVIEHTLTQVFTADRDDIVRLDFFQGTFGRTNEVELHVTVSDMETGEQICREVFDASGFKNNTWISIPIEEGALQAGRQYRVDFESPGATAADCICLYRTKDKLDASTYYMEDEEVQEYNLYIRLYEKERN